MMRANPTTLFLATGLLGAAGIAGYGVIKLMPARQAAPVAEVAAVPAIELPTVLVARRVIRRGELVRADDLSRMPVGGAVPPTAIGIASEVIGKTAISDIAIYQMIMVGMVSADATRAGLGPLIPPGYRAIQLRTTDEVAVGNFVRAGDHVDVHLVLPDPVLPTAPGTGAGAGPGIGLGADARSQGSQAESRILLQDVIVLAVGEQLGEPPEPPTDGSYRKIDPPHGVTVALTPEQVTRFTLARSLGTLFLALRNPADPQVVATVDARLADLRSPPPPADGRRGIDLITGSSSRVIFAQPGDMK